MIDFIDIAQGFCKDTPNFRNCNRHCSTYDNYGWEGYNLQGYRDILVLWHPERKELRIQCSLPYFTQGHNLCFSNVQYRCGIDLLEQLFHINLSDAYFNKFEWGAVFPVEGKAKDYIKYHSASAKSRLKENRRDKDNGNFKHWDGKGIDIKMYDPVANIKMKDGKNTGQVLESAGYDTGTDLLKFEVRYNNPPKLNRGRNILVKDFYTDEWIKRINEITISQYELLTPMKDLLSPTDKKQVSSIGIVLALLARVQMQDGIPLNDVKKQLYSDINGFDCLSTTDKNSRKATIRKAFDRLEQSDSSRWDISDKLRDALGQ